MKGLRTFFFAVSVITLTACSFDSSGVPGGNIGAPDAGAPSPDATRAPDGSVPPTQPDAGVSAAPGTLTSVSTGTAPALDGVREAIWNLAQSVELNMGTAELHFGVHTDYSFDASVRVSSLHDAESIYFLFEVTDDLNVNDSTTAYQDDAVEIYIDAAGDRNGPYGDDDHWIVVESDNTYDSLGPSAITITGQVEPTASGYTVEIAVRKADLGAAMNGQPLGFNVGLVDDDGLGNTDADAYGLWHVPNVPHCADCCSVEEGAQAWCDTTMLGRLILQP